MRARPHATGWPSARPKRSTPVPSVPVISRVLGGLGRVLIVTGLLILGFVAYQLWGTGLEESRRQDDLTHQLAADSGVKVDRPTDASATQVANALGKIDPATAPATAPPAAGEPIGVIEIPKIDLARVMVQGTERADLKKGPGHYTATPMPGQAGNAGVAGHRTTYGAPFNRIDELAPGDEVIVSTPQGRFTYVVIPAPGSTTQAWYTVDPSETDVLADKGDNRITLTACHPKYSASQRIIVNAMLRTPPAPTAPAPPQPATPAKAIDAGLGSTPDQLPGALAFGGAAALVALLAWLVARKAGHRVIIYAVAAPLVLFLVWNMYVHLDRYLPAI